VEVKSDGKKEEKVFKDSGDENAKDSGDDKRKDSGDEKRRDSGDEKKVVKVPEPVM